MKNNILKYIFFTFIIIIVIFAIYKIKEGENKKNQDESEKQINYEEKTVEQNLNLAIANFDTMNPLLSNNKYVQDISQLIYEPLISVSSNYEINGVLASEWAKTGATTYVIKLKDNVLWSNGEKFTAEDVLYTIDRLKELTSNIYIYNVQYIIRVEILDAYTIKIELSEEVPFFEYNLNFPIMCKNYYGEENFQNSEKTKKPLGTGKYLISDIQNTKISLQKNQNYWNKESEDTIIETIKINLYSSVGEMYNDFKLGKIDLINTSNVNIENYIGTIGYNKVQDIGREHDYLVFNTQNKVLINTEVRQAISYAIDKNTIIATTYNAKYTEADFPLAYSSWLYQGTKDKRNDSEKAKQILQDNGWEFKYNYWQKYVNYYTRKLNFRLVVNSSNANRVKVAETIKQQLEQIGIKINIIYANDNQYENYKKYKNYDMILCGTNIGTSPDLTKYFKEDNLANYQNDEAKAIINDLKNITDTELLKEKYKRLYEIYIIDVPYISLYHSYEIVAYSKNLAGSFSANWFNIFSNISSWSKK